MRQRTRDEHLFSPGPKRILALDGGGIRGIVSLQFLKLLEERLRQRHRADDTFRLCDYFDLVGGTSTGAIIAAGIALGFSAAELEAMYLDLGRKVFDSRWYRKGVMVPKFPAEPLREALEEKFGDVRLGDSGVRTGLAIIAKRLDTGSPWVLHNNPRGRYFERRPGSTAVPNKEYLVKALVRASTAAPTYFQPESIKVAAGVEGAFVDGGVSPHNNPSLQLLMLASLSGHALGWPLGADELLLLSVGTGSWEMDLTERQVMKMSAAKLGVLSLKSLMEDASALNEQLLQWLSRSPTGRVIDREVGDLTADVLGGGAPWLTYLRYEVWLEPEWLEETVGKKYTGKQLRALREMDNPENLDALAEVGREVAPRLMEESHLPASFDLPDSGDS